MPNTKQCIVIYIGERMYEDDHHHADQKPYFWKAWRPPQVALHLTRLRPADILHGEAAASRPSAPASEAAKSFEP